jgi:hypothetical protein
MKLLVLSLLSLVTCVEVAKADLSVGLAKKYARVVYDVALNGGSSTSHPLDATLPAGAVITDLWVYINTAFTDGGTSSLALQCGGTTNLMGYQDIAADAENDVFAVARSGLTFNGSSTTFIPESSSAPVAGISSVPSACEVTAVVRSDSGYSPYTGGKLTALIEYFQP